MREKDLTEKALLQYNDVFADIVNVLIFGGERIISPDDLTDTDPHTYYYDKDKIREQEQDVVKNCDSSQVQFACIGFENQTVADYFCQMQRNHCYIPSRTQFQHVQETLHLLAAVTDDDRFETSIINFEREVPNNMCEVIDNYINMGVEKGLIQGIELSRLESIKALMVKLDLSAAQAMNLLDISEEDQKKLKEKLS